MLKVVPNSFCSWSFRVEDFEGAVEQIDMAWVREHAEVTIDIA